MAQDVRVAGGTGHGTVLGAGAVTLDAPGPAGPAGRGAHPADGALPVDGALTVDAVRAAAGPPPQLPVVSVVMPCLNEEDSVAACVGKALVGLERAGLRGEVLVVDNGSTDRSVEVATAAGARVVHQPRRGYGNAYLAGFAAAQGEYIVMGDSDDSYDFSQLDRLLGPLLDGSADYVLGSRFAGKILPGAMPWTHRYIGNPVLTGLLNRLYHLDSSDAHSGMRAFTSAAYHRMHLRAEGMEFASEIVINAARAGLRVAEVPITYHPRTGISKLHSLRDGWRHLRFLLLHAPRHLFTLPGITLLAVGLVGQGVLLPGTLRIAGHLANMHVSALLALLAILGWQVLTLGLFADTYTQIHGIPTPRRWPLTWAEDHFTLERGILTGLGLFLAGFVVDLAILIDWIGRGLGPINQIRPALLALTLMVIGAQTAFGSFFLTLLHADRNTPRGQLPEPSTDVPVAAGR